jgi:putative transposase
MWCLLCHVVVVPKRRRKVIIGKTRQPLGAVFHTLAKQKECQFVEGHLMPDYVHICIAMPLKKVIDWMSYAGGKSPRETAMKARCGRADRRPVRA